MILFGLSQPMEAAGAVVGASCFPLPHAPPLRGSGQPTAFLQCGFARSKPHRTTLGSGILLSGIEEFD